MNLKKWIEEKGWTKTNFAAMLGVSRSSVYKWFNNTQPSKYAIQRIEKLTQGKVTEDDWNKDT